jgi:hypothetical protein
MFDAWIPIIKMSSRKMEAATSGVCDGARSGSAGPVGPPSSPLGDLGEASGISMICVGAWSGQLALFIVIPFISLVGLAFVARLVASD